MKKTLTIAAMAVLGLAAFTGCSKSSSSPSNNMTATINGASFSEGNTLAIVNSGLLSIESGTTSTGITYPSIQLVVSNYTGAGTYTINSSGGNAFGIDSSTSSATGANAAGGSGTLTITSASTSSMSGTFNFTCADGTTVTNGVFSAKVN